MELNLPQLGELWPEEGGVYCGDRIIEGQLVHIVFKPSPDDNIEITGPSVLPAFDAGWRPPVLEDYMLAFVNAKEYFPCEAPHFQYAFLDDYTRCIKVFWTFNDYSGFWRQDLKCAIRPVGYVVAPSPKEEQ